MMHFIDKLNTQFQESLLWLENHDVYSIDTETTGLDPQTDKVLLLQIGNAQDQWVYDIYRLRHDLSPVLQYLQDETKIKILHNAQFDYKMLKGHFGISMNNLRCTMIAEQLLNRGLNTSASLAFVAKKYLDIDLDKTERASFLNTAYGQKLTKEQIEYAGDDVVFLEAILEKQMKEIRAHDMEVVSQIEFDVISVLGDMSFAGIYIDPARWLPLEEAAIKNSEKLKIELDGYFLPLLPPPPPPPPVEYYKNGKQKKPKKQKPWGVNYNSAKQVLPLLQALS